MTSNIKSNSFLTACCDEVSHTTALKKCAVLNRWKQPLGKCHHLSQTNPHDCSLRIYRMIGNQNKTEYKESFSKPSEHEILETYFCIISHFQAINKTCCIWAPWFGHPLKMKKRLTKWRILHYIPAATATTFFRVPHSSTPSISWTY